MIYPFLLPIIAPWLFPSFCEEHIHVGQIRFVFIVRWAWCSCRKRLFRFEWMGKITSGFWDCDTSILGPTSIGLAGSGLKQVPSAPTLPSANDAWLQILSTLLSFTYQFLKLAIRVTAADSVIEHLVFL